MYDKKEICTFPRGILSRLILLTMRMHRRGERERKREGRLIQSSFCSRELPFPSVSVHIIIIYCTSTSFFSSFFLSLSLFLRLVTTNNSFSPLSLSHFFYVASYKLVALTLSARISPRPFEKKKKTKVIQSSRDQTWLRTN